MGSWVLMHLNNSYCHPHTCLLFFTHWHCAVVKFSHAPAPRDFSCNFKRISHMGIHACSTLMGHPTALFILLVYGTCREKKHCSNPDRVPPRHEGCCWEETVFEVHLFHQLGVPLPALVQGRTGHPSDSGRPQL